MAIIETTPTRERKKRLGTRTTADRYRSVPVTTMSICTMSDIEGIATLTLAAEVAALEVGDLRLFLPCEVIYTEEAEVKSQADA
jgi:hypothetical protein